MGIKALMDKVEGRHIMAAMWALIPIMCLVNLYLGFGLLALGYGIGAVVVSFGVLLRATDGFESLKIDTSSIDAQVAQEVEVVLKSLAEEYGPTAQKLLNNAVFQPLKDALEARRKALAGQTAPSAGLDSHE